MHRRSLALALLALYLATRLAVLLTNVDEASVPVYEVPSMGNAAWLAATGWRGVPWDASYDNAGGQVLTAWLAAPFYVLLGDRYVALKLVPLVLGALLLGMLWRVVERARGVRAANLAGLVYVLAPPLLFKYSLLAKGNHFEGLFFAFVPLWLLVEGEGRPRRAVFVALAGFAAGVAVSVYVGALATLVALAVGLLAWRGPLGAARDVARMLPGFLVGLLPAVALHVASDSRTGAFVQKMTSVDAKQADFRAEARELATVHLPRATCCEDLGPLSGATLDLVYLVAAVSALLGTLALAAPKGAAARRGLRRGLALVVVSTPLIAFAALLFTSLRVKPMPHPAEVGGLRYFVPVHFWTLVAIPLVAAALLDRRTGAARIAGWVLLAGALAPGLSSLTLVRPSRDAAELAWSYPGSHMRLATTLMGRAAYMDPKTGFQTCTPAGARAFLDALGPLERRDLAHALGSRLAFGAFVRDAAAPLEAVLAPLPESDRVEALRGVGAFLAQALAGAPATDTSSPLALALAALLQGPDAQEVAFGLGTSTEYPLHLYLAADVQRARALAARAGARRADVWRGLGADCGRRVARGAKREREAVVTLTRELGPDDATSFWRGLADELAVQRAASREPEMRDLEWIPAAHVAAVRAVFEPRH